MLFQTPEFFFLLLLSSLFYWAFPKGRVYILGVASAVFYGWAGTGYLILFAVMSVCTYLCSVYLYRTGRRIFLWLGLLINLGNLVFFKYALFLLREITGLTGLVLVPPGSILGQLVLPIGISFYTFQLVAYLVDVSRGEIVPPSLVRFWVFISFFAQLVAGPIMRGKDFLPQVARLEKVRFQAGLVKWGIFFIALGLFKKVVVADHIAPAVDWFFARPRYVSGLQAWLGAYLFGFQIYLDFSGYSDIALGLGKLFGLELTRNFATPYFSRNPSEFWRRWHITLSGWVRDYIYIPLGGSRKGPARRNINLFLAMTVCGFWHGAAWTFLIWGAFHGLVLVIYHQVKSRWSFAFLSEQARHLLSVFLTWQIVTLGWVFFRAPSLPKAFTYIGHMFLGFGLNDLLSNKKSLLLVALLGIFHWGEDRFLSNPAPVVAQWAKVPAFCRGLVYFFIFGLILAGLPNGLQQFIYFRF
ncbi:MBOAT family O-acyltransferase [Candidatus Formimonas warabiya]|uniref:MBOAT family protein n=1 Tax=Formimonas warabiya TaxID=1761012 RepID=A0A3G1KPY0_FORW1|nr:MBOAT family O-acyltransferase [Candidatus Formimonas warabiya]ATW24522.1 hypothetical protein DCMF_06770 [Candidatus Formimonas warabiya]